MQREAPRGVGETAGSVRRLESLPGRRAARASTGAVASSCGMPSVAVVTDTTHYIPRELADSLAIHQVSLYVNWEGGSEHELQMDGFDGFYERLRTDPVCRAPRSPRSATSLPYGSH